MGVGREEEKRKEKGVRNGDEKLTLRVRDLGEKRNHP